MAKISISLNNILSYLSKILICQTVNSFDQVEKNFRTMCGGSKGSTLRLRLSGSVVQPRVSDDLLTYKAIGSNYLSFVVTSMLVSTSPLDEAGTATHFPLPESSGRKGPANVVSSADHPITSGSPVWRVKRERAPIAVNRLGCTTSELL